jgi:hypothetical protein
MLALCVVVSGCTTLFPGRSEDAEKEARLKELMTVPEAPDLIRQAAIPHGMRPVQVDGVGLVLGLRGTGGPADPSGFRDQLLEELKRDDIRDPNHLLEQNDTALVRVRAIVPPGAQRRDRLDIRLLSPTQSRATDLHSGKLSKTRTRHQQMIKNVLRKSDVLLIGQGHILTRGDYEPAEDETLKIEGTILSGGLVQVDRKLGLVLRPEFEHAKLASDLAAAVNRRFFFFDGTTRRGIAKAVEDDFIELDLHPRYRANVYRLMEVVRAIGVSPESSESHKRLTELAARLASPAAAADAALQLEAIGESAIPTLIEGTRSSNPELRFYAAEALAYLDRVEAIEPLEEAAREVAAFRHDALLALQELPRQASVDALKRLMDEPSLETRYGSFCAIRRRKDARGGLSGRDLGPMNLHRIPSKAPPAIVISLREQPEIVLFGSPADVTISGVLMAPNALMLKPAPKDPAKVEVIRFSPGEEDRRITVDASVASVIQGITSVGGAYGDVVAALRIAKDQGFLSDQLAIDPLPRPLRTYHRDQSGEDDADDRDADSEQSDSDMDDAEIAA